MTYMIALLFVAAGLLGLRAAAVLFGDATAPAGLYSATWSFSLALYYLRLVSYDQLLPSTVAVFVGAAACFWAGAVSSRLLMKSRTTRRVDPVGLSQAEDLSLFLTCAFLLLLSLIGVALYFRLVQQTIGLSTLWFDPRRVRFEESYGALRHLGVIGVLRGMSIPTFVLSVLCARFARTARRRLAGWGMAVVVAVPMLPSSGRTTLFNMAVWTGVAIVYSRARGSSLNARRWLRVALPAAALLLVYFIVTTSLLNKGLAGRRIFFSTVLTGRFEALIDPYHYAVGPLVAFQKMLAAPNEFGDNGVLTVGVVSRILNEIDPSSFKYPEYVQPFVFTPIPSNVYTYLDAYLLDIGVAGLFVMPFVMGLLTTVVFQRAMTRRTVFSIYLASLLSLCTLATTTVNRYGNLQTAQWMAVWLIFAVVRHFVRTPLYSSGTVGEPLVAIPGWPGRTNQ